MTASRGGRLPLTVLVVASGLLIASVTWIATRSWRPMMFSGAMMGSGMMGAGISGDGPVRSLDGGEWAAGCFADRWV